MPKKDPIALFSWGFWGWGTCIDKLNEAVTAVEKARRKKPPLFVDVRIQRSGRAPGFKGNPPPLKEELKDSRYEWIPDLGNQGILDWGPMRIRKPAAARDLLCHARERAQQGQRVIFFCACEWPGTEKEVRCHRVKVGSLVLREAQKAGVAVEVVEWPGGEPTLDGLELTVSDKVFKALRGTRKSIPLENTFSLAEMAGLPWGSVVTVQSDSGKGDSAISLMVGPAKYENGWYLPVLERASSAVRVKKQVKQWRRENGYEPRMA